MKPIFTLPALLLLGACAEPIPPSRSAQDLVNAQVEHSRLNALEEVADPTGSATFAGQIGASLKIDDETGAFLGDLDLQVNFNDRLRGVSGRVTDITLFDEAGEPDQDLGGALAIKGGYNETLNATATGRLTAVETSGSIGFSGTSLIKLNMGGRLVDDDGTNVLVGTFTGGSSGNDDDYDVSVTGDAEFYAIEN